MSAIKKIAPLLNRVLVMKIEPPKQSVGGIILPETKQKHSYRMGKVIAVGPGIVKDDGEAIPMCLKNGDKVLFPDIGGLKVECDGKECYLYKDYEILAVV